VGPARFAANGPPAFAVRDVSGRAVFRRPRRSTSRHLFLAAAAGGSRRDGRKRYRIDCQLIRVDLRTSDPSVAIAFQVAGRRDPSRRHSRSRIISISRVGEIYSGCLAPSSKHRETVGPDQGVEAALLGVGLRQDSRRSFRSARTRPSESSSRKTAAGCIRRLRVRRHRRRS